MFLSHRSSSHLRDRGDNGPLRKLKAVAVMGFNKVRDLPLSGIVYLNRIKPISDEFKGAIARANNTFVRETASSPLRELDIEPQRSAENDYTVGDANVKENTASVSAEFHPENDAHVMDSAAVLPTLHSVSSTEETITELPTLPTIRRTTTKETELQSLKPKKNMLKIAISKKSKNIGSAEEYDLSREAQIDLDRLITQIKQQGKVDLIEEHPTVTTKDLRKTGYVSGRTVVRHGNPNAKLVSLSRSANVHAGEIIRKPSKAKLIQLKKKKSFGRVGSSQRTQRRGPDFDPWERIGQK
ncbi:hypothetical protein RB195_005959 [Necator americanus]|uniref:Uncharacterized protein n=1 Tax=Necator americanus TaxID=51031 RepID=A0ABR1BS68_NECAM